MKISEHWLREWVNPPVDSAALAARLTMAGLEVEAMERCGAAVEGVVTAEVRNVQPHPDAARLRVCQVFDGQSEFQVVCGAANVRPGLCVAFAKEGATLPGMRIARATLRGVESFGMLCSADELGLVEQRADGLIELPPGTAPGQDVGALFGREDRAISLKLTPNRGDCLGMLGIARETSALYGLPMRAPGLEPVPAVCEDRLAVDVASPDDCPCYAGRVIRGVDVSVPSPLWLQERLRRAGLRSIDAVVDVTNYVMLELGQPLHAFDLGQLRERIVVRRALAGETLALLDGSELTLRPDTLVIADAGGAVALAGIMGGRDSAVGEGTQDIFLEAAFFAPQPMAGKARSYGMQTDASQRFERGVDFRLQAVAIERATRLLLDIVGGTPGPVVLANAEDRLPVLAPIRLRAERLAMLLGVDVPAVEVASILERLGLGVEPATGGWQVTPASFRFDIRMEADLAEEVGRVWGYDRIPMRVQPAAERLRPTEEASRPLPDLRRRLCALGYQEAITYSFVSPAMQALLDPQSAACPVANPISSDMAVMRSSLWAGLLTALQHNQNRQQRRVRLFESGLRFLSVPAADVPPDRSPIPTLDQRMAIAGIASGSRHPENWTGDGGAIDFFDIKGDVEALLDTGDGESAGWVFEPAEHPALHPGQSARLRRGEQVAGFVGALHPRILAALDLVGPIYLFELDLAEIRRKTLPSFKGLSRFPEVRRDMALVLDEAVPAEDVLSVAREAAGQWLKDLKLFDVYRGQGIEPNKKSVAIGIVLQHPERTLTDAEVTSVVEGIVAALATHCGAVQRY